MKVPVHDVMYEISHSYYGLSRIREQPAILGHDVMYENSHIKDYNNHITKFFTTFNYPLCNFRSLKFWTSEIFIHLSTIHRLEFLSTCLRKLFFVIWSVFERSLKYIGLFNFCPFKVINLAHLR